MNKIFVYGTLLKGLVRHSALASSKCLGVAKEARYFAAIMLKYGHEKANNRI